MRCEKCIVFNHKWILIYTFSNHNSRNLQIYHNRHILIVDEQKGVWRMTKSLKRKIFECNIVYNWLNRVLNMLVWFLFLIISILWHIINFTINYWKIVVLFTFKWFVRSKEIHDTNHIRNSKIVTTIWDTLCSYFLTEAYRDFYYAFNACLIYLKVLLC